MQGEDERGCLVGRLPSRIHLNFDADSIQSAITKAYESV